MRRLSLFVLLFCLIATATQGQAEAMKAYESDKFGFYFSFPQSWTLVPDEANANFALYSPEALADRKNLDLTAGLKIEILAKTKEELENFFARNDLRQEVKGSNQYYFRDKDYYYLFTVIKGPKWSFVLIGYFPEKTKEASYIPQYQEVVGTFTLI